MRPAPYTFGNKTDANAWLSDKEVEIRRGDWYDPDGGAIPLDEYAPRWIDERPNLQPRTVELYHSLYERHLKPHIGRLGLSDITYARVRTWRKERLAAGVGPGTVAKSYRLLKAVMNTAVDDGLVRRNPCRIKGGGAEAVPERPTVSLDEVFAIAAEIDKRYRALVLLATFASMRYGELMGLRRSDIDLQRRRIRIVRAVKEVRGQRYLGPTKHSNASGRTVSIPGAIVGDLRHHLATYAEEGSEGRVFVGPRGATPLRSNFHKHWVAATKAAGVDGLHLHDLRHTGATTAAATGATTRELMQRLGHSSTRAAMIYQHATDERDQAIADGLDKLIRDSKKRKKKGSGS